MLRERVEAYGRCAGGTCDGRPDFVLVSGQLDVAIGRAKGGRGAQGGGRHGMRVIRRGGTSDLDAAVKAVQELTDILALHDTVHGSCKRGGGGFRRLLGQPPPSSCWSWYAVLLKGGATAGEVVGSVQDSVPSGSSAAAESNIER